MLKRLFKSEKGITGLETAIILIAFVVVAAVFAYTVLSAGLFSTQKSQEAVYAGLQEAQSTVKLEGAIIGKAAVTTETGYLGQLTFTLSNALDGEPIDFKQPTADVTTGIAANGSSNVVVISYIDQSQKVEDLYWTYSPLGSADADDLLEPGEKFQITVGGASDVAGAGNLVNALNPNLTINKTFSIQVKGPKGAVLTMERTTPPFFDSVISLN